MFKKKFEFLNINENKSFSINYEKRNSSISNIKFKHKNIISPKTPKLIDSKSQTNIFSLRKKIKISFNKYHQYIKNTGALKKNENNKTDQLSPNINNKTPNENFINNNRNEIQNNYSFLTKYKSFYGKNNTNLNSQMNKTMQINNNNYKMSLRRQKLNRLNLVINNQSAKSSSFIDNYHNNINDEESIFTKIQNNNQKTCKNIAPFTIQNLKNSKFFYKTKYVTGLKNKNFKNTKNSFFSTYNISFQQEDKNEEIYKTINELIKNKLLNKMKTTESKDLNIINMKQAININKKNLNQTQTFNTEKANYFKILPFILDNLNKKQTIDDIYKEYNLYFSKSSSDVNNKNKKDNNIEKIKYPKIKYLFLENVINSLNHLVKFINVKSKEELEQNVMNVIRDEYNKLKEKNKDIESIQDFLTFGYEYIPKHSSFYKLPNLKETGFQTSQMFYHKKKDNVSNINKPKEEKKPEIKENKTYEKISNLKNFYINQGYKSHKRIFGRTEIKTRNDKNKVEIEKGLNHFSSSSNINEKRKNDNKDVKDLINNQSPIKNRQKFSPKTKFIKINLKKDKNGKNIDKNGYENGDKKENNNDRNNNNSNFINKTEKEENNTIDNYIKNQAKKINKDNNNNIKKYEEKKEISNNKVNEKEENKK